MPRAEPQESGTVGANTSLISTGAAPFGGMPPSVPGRAGSRHGRDGFLDIKYINMGDLDQ